MEFDDDTSDARMPLDPATISNADETPLLQEMKGGKRSVAYIKVTRLDGAPGERGYKGRLRKDASLEDLAREFGNGTYKIDAMNSRGTLIPGATAEYEIALPDPVSAKPPAAAGGSQTDFAVQSLRVLQQMSGDHQAEQASVAARSNDNVRDMAQQFATMLTEFTTSTREAERAAHQTVVAQQQQFFMAMLQMNQSTNETMLRMVTAREERDDDGADPVELLMRGLELGRAISGDAGEAEGDPVTAALREGSTMLGNLVQLAGMDPPNNRPRGLPTGAAAAAPDPRQPQNGRPGPARARPPKPEVQAFGQLCAVLRERGIPVADFLRHTAEDIKKVPDSALFAAGDDGPGGSAGNAAAGENESGTGGQPAARDV